MRDKHIQLRVNAQEKNKIKHEALKRGFQSIGAFLFWLIHQAQIGKIILIISLSLHLSGCLWFWAPAESRARSLEKMAEIERERFELEKQQSKQNPAKQPTD